MENKSGFGRLSGKGSRPAKTENREPADGGAGGFWLGKLRRIPAEKRTDLLLALLMAAALFVPVVVRFDFYYDLNDDVLIKDILSGVYSGTPEGHTMQLLYPLGFCLSLLYRALSIPVFGVFLVLCQYGSIFAIAYRTLRRCGSWQAKLLALLAEAAFWAAAFGSHLVFIQYTVTSGMLAGAAIFWMLTAKERAAAAFLKENLPALILYWLAFCLRSEMALLLLPLAGVAGLCKWGQEKRVFTKENACKYLLTFGTLLLGLAVCLGVDSLAYAGEDWSAFRRFFDARTELYDYQKDFVDSYGENAASYEALGVSREQQALLANYNFGVDDSIDETMLEKLREAALNRPEAGGFFRKSAAEGIWSLLRGHWTVKTDFPYNIVFLLCGAFVFVLCFFRGRRHLLWQAPLCAVTGALLWMFLLLRDRPAERVLHPLYLAQILVFAGLLLLETGKDEKRERDGRSAGRKTARGSMAAAALSVLVLCLCAPGAVGTWQTVSEEYARRETVNQTNEAVLAYCSAHPDRLYLEDVYSTVSYSEKISVDRNKPFNYDLLGGWLVKSPLTKEKLSAFGYASMGGAVCAGEKVSLLAETESDMLWLEDYFAWKQIPVRVVKTGTVTEGVEVYQVLPQDTGESIR